VGKRDPKPQFVDVACSNKDCELYGFADQGKWNYTFKPGNKDVAELVL